MTGREACCGWWLELRARRFDEVVLLHHSVTLAAAAWLARHSAARRVWLRGAALAAERWAGLVVPAYA